MAMNAMLNQDISQEGLRNMKLMIANFCRIEDGSLRTDVNLRQYGMDTGDAITNVLVQELSTIHPNILKLDMTNCKMVNDVGIWAIARHCVKIQELILFGCDGITNVGIRSLSLRCSDITVLDLSFCHLLDDISLTIIAGGSWKIKHLYLRHCTRISDNGLSRIAQGLGGSLEILDLRGCNNVGEFGDRGLKEIGAHCEKLKDLFVPDAKRIEDGGLIALATGCHKLEHLTLSGCESITRKGFKNFCKNISNLKIFSITGCRKLADMDMDFFRESKLPQTLTCLELRRFERLTDRGVAVIAKHMGGTLHELSLQENVHLTDYSAMIISNMCGNLRRLNLTSCGNFTDDSVHSIATGLTCLTTLKLDGNNRIRTRALLRHANNDLEFAEMATHWLGYQPKANAEKMIHEREVFNIQTAQAIKIQSIIRRKFAERVFWERHRDKLVNVIIPLFQAHVRGYLQRKRFALIRTQIRRIRMVIKIQARFRAFLESKRLGTKLKNIRNMKRRNKYALLIQRYFRGSKGRQIALAVRVLAANKRMLEAKEQARREVKATYIQKIFKGFKARKLAAYLTEQERLRRERAALELKCTLLILRIAHGKLGRMRAQARRREIAWEQLCWFSAIFVQRMYRGRLGRLRFKYFWELEQLRLRNVAATQIQRIYRGYRGMLLASVARALKELRAKQNFFAVEIQRVMRGCIGRRQFKLFKEIQTRRQRQEKAATVIQTLFRGFKGKEAMEIEKELQGLEGRANPLILHLKHLEERLIDLEKLISRLDGKEKMMADNLFELERELHHCIHTTNKYTDSTRINSTPQRFLTNFLKVRLKDLLDHETEVHRLQFVELQRKRAELRDVTNEVKLTQRELIPLTTGLIADVKRKRTERLRNMVRLQRKNSVVIQSLWRRALVRKSLYDPYKLHWVQRLDREQSDKPFFLNLQTGQQTWQMPLAYRYFGVSQLDGYEEEEEVPLEEIE